MADLLLRNARVIDPANGIDDVREVAVADGVLVAPDAVAGRPGVIVHDLAGKAVVPGFVDLHVHFREPGFEYKEDLASGTRCAAAGGFTTVVLMPNTKPAMDRPERLRDLAERLAVKARVHCLASACLSVDRAGKAITDIEALARDPLVVALSDDGNCVQNLDLMRQAARLARQVNLPILDHCEDEAVMAGGVVRAGAAADCMRIPGMPSATESNIVERNVRLARETGARMHCQHLSCRRSVELVRQAQAEGLPVTAEASPHHLVLTDSEVPILGPGGKMNPPLGTDDDRQALHEALADGTIAAIATDHAPHAPHEKAQGMVQAPFGIIGLETAFALCYTELCVEHRVLTLPELVARFTCGPAAILGIGAGSLSLGAPADLAVVDLGASYRIDVRRTQSRSLNSPFHQRQASGRIVATLCGGAWVHRA